MIAVDIDGVTQEFQCHWIRLYEEEFDHRVPYELRGSWDCLIDGTHFKSGAAFFKWYEYAEGWATMPYHCGARTGLRKLRQLGVPFKFVTARPDEAIEATAWLARDWDVEFEIRGADDKRNSPDVDLWIDDGPHVLSSLAEHGKDSIRFIQPWNEGSPATFHAASWDEVVEIVKSRTS